MNAFRSPAFVILFLGITSVAFAQEGQPPVTITPVQEVLTNTPDDAYVTIQGRLVEYLGVVDYVLEDVTGRITVEIDDDLIAQRYFATWMLVEEVGEVVSELHDGVHVAERTRILHYNKHIT